MHITRERQKVVVPFNQFGLVATVKQVSVATVTKVVVDSVRRRKRLHEFRTIRLRRLENQMEMIRHANEHVQSNIERLDTLAQTINEAFVVRIILEKKRLVRLPIAYHTAGDVVDRSRIFNSQLSCHKTKYGRTNYRLQSLFFRADRHIKACPILGT